MNTSRSITSYVRWAIMVFVLLVEAALSFRLGSTLNGPDAGTYVQNADSFSSLTLLLSPAAFQSNYWPAGYSGFIQLFSPLADSALVAVRISQALMLVGMAWMGWALTRRFGDWTSTATFAAIALSPSLLWFSLVIGYEVLLAFLVTLAFAVLWLRWWPTLPLAGAAVAGLSVSFALIVQFKTVVVVPVLLVIAYRTHWRVMVGFLAALALPVGLWMVRNAIAVGSAAPWSTNGPVNIWIGNNPQATGGYMDPPSIPSGWGADYGAAALHWISSEPRAFSELVAVKAARLFFPNIPVDYHVAVPQWVDTILVVFAWSFAVTFTLLFALFIAAWMWRLPLPITCLMPLAVYVLLIIGINLPFIAEPRFRVPVEPLMLAVCVPTAAVLIRRRLPGNRVSRAPG